MTDRIAGVFRECLGDENVQKGQAGFIFKCQVYADTLEQAIERAGSKAGNKGWDCGLAAVEMANLMGAVEKL